MIAREIDEEAIYHSWTEEEEPEAPPPPPTLVSQASQPTTAMTTMEMYADREEPHVEPNFEPLTPEKADNLWPTGLLLGMRWESTQKARRFFEQKVRESNFPISLIGRQNSQGSSYRLGCLLCDAYVQLRCNSNYCELVKFNNRHSHKLESRKHRHMEQLEKEVFKYLRESAQTQIRRSAMQVFSLSENEYERFRRNFYMKEVHDYTYLQNFMREHKYNAIVDWDEVRGAYPKRIVAVSEAMKRNYRRYRDLLRFDLVEAVLKNRIDTSKRYSLGLFSVVDCCNRVVLAGIAVFNEQSEENFGKLFENLARLHDGLVPDVILSDCSVPMLKAVASLQQRQLFCGANITHIYDPKRIVRKIRQSLLAARKPTAETVLDQLQDFIARIVETKSSTEYDSYMKSISELALPEGVIRDLVGCSSKICYLHMPRRFIGLNRYSVVSNSREVASKLEGQTTILELFRRITELDASQAKMQETQVFREPIENVLGDPRVGIVRLSTDRRLFQLFMENYFKALGMSAQRLFNHSTGGIDFIVQELTQGNQTGLGVTNWQCSCSEHLKTGVPCSHLLACALSTPDKNYLELFKKRWRTARPAEGTWSNINE